MKHLNIKALALSFGIAWGAGLMILGWVSMTGWGIDLVDVLSSFYIGYKSSFFGGFVGAVWGFIDGAVSVVIVAYLYNFFCSKEK